MKKNTVFYLLLVLLLALYLRVHNLGLKCLWFDEGLDVFYVWTMGLVFLFVPAVSPLQSILLYFWKGFASNEFMFRLPAVMFSVISIYIFYLLTSIVFNKKAGLLSAFILAISPFHLYYAQECRAYSLSCMLVLSSMYFFVRSLKENKIILWACFISFTLLGAYTHYITLFVLGLVNIFFLFNYKKYQHLIRRWCFVNTIILFLILPAIKILVLTRYPYANWWVPSVGWYTIPITLKNFCIGYNAPFLLYQFATCVFILLFIYGVIKARKNEFLWLFLGCLFFPLFVVFLISLIKPSYYIDRHFMPFSVFFYILVAYGISAIKRKYLFFIVLSCIAIFSLMAIRNYYAGYLPNSFTHHIGVQNEKDTRRVAGYLMDNFAAGDMICFSDENAIPQLWYYLSPHYLKNAYNGGIFREVDKKLILEYDEKKDIILASVFLKPSPPQNHEPASVSFDSYKRIWLVACYNEKGITKALSKKFTKNDLVKFEGVKVYLFLVDQKL